jgi:hypothetical protein
LTENGVEFKTEATIYYGTRNDVDNYYSLDGENWILYTGKFNASNGIIYAKSVKKNTGLTASTSKTISMPSDAIGLAAYDGNTSTFVSVGQTLKLLIDNNMQNRNVKITSWTSSGYSVSTFKFYDDSNTLLSTQTGQASITKEYSIPEGATYMTVSKGSSVRIYEIGFASL